MKADVQTILLVEDEPALLDITAYALGSFGYVIEKAENGKRALEVVEALARSIDLLITDLNMPWMDGFELEKKLRKQFRDMRVIFISGAPEPEQCEAIQSMTYAELLLKPFTPEDLQKLVIEAVGDAVNENEAPA